jgi:GNAT superfamily N-acetyltransferase
MLHRNGESPSPITIGSETDGDTGTEIEARLAEDITARFGEARPRRVVLAARCDGRLIGGITGSIHWGWLYIRQMWVAEDARGAGTGTALLLQAVAEAEASACAGIYVDTFEERTARFYERSGFDRVGLIPGFPPGHARIFLARQLGTHPPKP